MKGIYYLGFMLICSSAFGQTGQNSNSGASSTIEVPSQTLEKEKTTIPRLTQENTSVPAVHYKISPEEKAIRRREEMPVMIKIPEQN